MKSELIKELTGKFESEAYTANAGRESTHHFAEVGKMVNLFAGVGKMIGNCSILTI